HAGLAVPDFPLAHGRLWPATAAESVAGYNTARRDVLEPNPITAAHICVHMTHRLGACVLLGAAVLLFVKTRRTVLSRFGIFWLAVLLVQASLGASVVWTNKAADLATLHVVCGALALVSVSLAAICAWRAAGQGTVDVAARLPADSPTSRAAGTA
ncbi:MAG: COX15/CtaA family protein, partial [Verrucomicrobia bacterium]|nr:COX15/CtaA family protein [Verrucomicrobiota bacterium]